MRQGCHHRHGCHGCHGCHVGCNNSINKWGSILQKRVSESLEGSATPRVFTHTEADARGIRGISSDCSAAITSDRVSAGAAATVPSRNSSEPTLEALPGWRFRSSQREDNGSMRGKHYLLNGRPVEAFTIGELADLLERSPHTIRRWEREGVLPKCLYRLQSRDARGRRRMYTEDQLWRITNAAAKAGLGERRASRAALEHLHELLTPRDRTA
jgi:hypothetical protein